MRHQPRYSGTFGEKLDRRDVLGTIRVDRLSESEPISNGGTQRAAAPQKQVIGPPHIKQFSTIQAISDAIFPLWRSQSGATVYDSVDWWFGE